jgi:hypothetical protein
MSVKGLYSKPYVVVLFVHWVVRLIKIANRIPKVIQTWLGGVVIAVLLLL